MTSLTRHGHVARRDSPSPQAARRHTLPFAFVRRLRAADLHHVAAQAVCHHVMPVDVLSTTLFVVPRDALRPGRHRHCGLRNELLSEVIGLVQQRGHVTGFT